VVRQKEHVKLTVKKLHNAGIPVSLFINPSIMDVDISKETGADMVEIHTGLYSNAKGNEKGKELQRVQESVRVAHKVGLSANAGHGLNYFNVSRIAGIEGLRGLYIGHSIVSRAVLVGFERAVGEMKELIRQSAVSKSSNH